MYFILGSRKICNIFLTLKTLNPKTIDMGLGTPEIILILIALVIPTTVIFVVVRYFSKSQKLKQEQIELLKKIADK